MRVRCRLVDEAGDKRAVGVVLVVAVDVRPRADVEAGPGVEYVEGRAGAELHHHAGLDVEPVGDPGDVAAGVHQELLADHELCQHDEGERLEERVVLRSAQSGRIAGDVRHRVGGLDESVGFGDEPEAVQAVVLNA